jgi:hypothetical protein
MLVRGTPVDDLRNNYTLGLWDGERECCDIVAAATLRM